MNIAALVFNPVAENTYILWDATNECVIVDAGNSTQRESAILDEFIASRGLTPKMAINTHGHFDHTMGVEHLRDKYQIPFALSSADRYLLDSCKSGSVVYGIPIGAMPSTIDVDLDTTKEIHFGETTLQVIKSPGHTPGHILLYHATQKILITGDTLFRESIGRTDLPGGDYPSLMDSILKQILPLGDEVVIYPGHGEDSTIGHESLYNPFVVEVLTEQIKY